MRSIRPIPLSLALAALALAAVAAVPASAQNLALDFTGASAENTSGAVATAGWTFDVTNASGINVSDLLFWDSGADGLGGSHQVGIWNSAGTLLASTTIAAGTGNPLDATGKFRVASISPVFLASATGYTIGATFAIADDTAALSVTGFSVASAINYGITVFNNGAGLNRPTSSLGTSVLIGPDFQFTTAGATAPEPGSLALLALVGLPVVGLIRRRSVR